MNNMISTGISFLDKITGGLKLGDNVVWQVADGLNVDQFIRSFFDANAEFKRNVVYVNSNYSPHTIYKRYKYLFESGNITLIDAFTNGKGNSDPVFLEFYEEKRPDPSTFYCVENPRDISSFISILNDFEKRHSQGAFYLFDSLTGLYELWKDETAVVDFFAFTCPKLYDLNTLAYWIFERDAHSKEFVASITHITQVVFAISAAHADFYRFAVQKLEDRSSFRDSEPRYFRIEDSTVRFETERAEDNIRVGERVKLLRKEKKITQAELAGVLNMTPGAISQIENNVTSPSLQTLVQLSSLFNKPLEYFVGLERNGRDEGGFQIFRGGDLVTSAHRNVTVRRLVDRGASDLKIYRVTVEAGAVLEGPVLLHKGQEYCIIIEGEIEVSIAGDVNILKKGDTLSLSTSFVDHWKNTGGDCHLLYILS